MTSVLDAVWTFFGHLGSVSWAPLGLAVLCHLAKMLARSRAWRNTLAAAYPDQDVRWRHVLGAWGAGVGVNAVLPARGGDILRLFLMKRKIEGARYPTLAATMLVETLFDTAIALLLLTWAVSSGMLPALDVLPHLPTVDWFWLFRNPKAAALVGIAFLFGGFFLGLWAGPRITDFRRRVAQGFTVVRTPARYFRTVVSWQALDWVFRLFTVYFFLRAFGVSANIENTLAVQVSQSLSTILPLTPAGIGTEQVLVLYVLAGEASSSVLLSLSVGMKLVIIATNIAVGALALGLMVRTLRWRQVIDRVEGRRTQPEEG